MVERVIGFFEDAATDARMRRTIPRYARLGGVLVALSAPFLTDDPQRRLALFGLVAIAIGAAQLFSWRDLIERVPRSLVYAMLLFYCVLISLAAAMTDDPNSPLRLLMILPVTFTAVFFTGWTRFGTAIASALIDELLLGSFVKLTLTDAAVRLLVLLLIASFAGEVASMLRDSLRAALSLHAVLEAASGDPLAIDLAEIGLDAGLSVAGWDCGAVMLVRESDLEPIAYRGFSDGLVNAYRAGAVPIESTSVGADVLRTGEPKLIEDIPARVGADHPLVADGVMSLAGIPISYHQEVIGVFVVGHRTKRRLADGDRDQLERVARQLGLALGNAAAYRRESQVAEDLRELHRRKDQFLANISHELRTPAATIKLVTAMLSERPAQLTDAQVSEMHSTLERRASQLCELIDNLLAEARADSGDTRLSLETIDWREAVVRWAELAQLQSAREFTLQIPAGSVSGIGDAVKLERAVSNLLSNAAKFSAPGSPIVVALSADDRKIQVAVTDQGTGIPESQLANVFDRFHQVDASTTRAVGGFGIGLSLARHFVEAHGGTIEVRSAEGEGSTFTITVPRVPPRPEPGVDVEEPVVVADSQHR